MTFHYGGMICRFPEIALIILAGSMTRRGMGASLQVSYHLFRGLGTAPKFCILWSSPSNNVTTPSCIFLCLSAKRCHLWGRLQAWVSFGWETEKKSPCPPLNLQLVLLYARSHLRRKT